MCCITDTKLSTIKMSNEMNHTSFLMNDILKKCNELNANTLNTFKPQTLQLPIQSIDTVGPMETETLKTLMHMWFMSNLQSQG